MASNREPEEPPPPYSAASGPSSSSAATSTAPQQSSSSHLQVPNPQRTRNGIPPDVRRSMEDENRDLPAGWVRQFDPQTQHQFYVDTTAAPPRSIWHHPHDDEPYMNSLSPHERDRIRALHPVPSPADMLAESSDDDLDEGQSQNQSQSQTQNQSQSQSHSYAHAELPPRPSQSASQAQGVHRLGRKVKDKLTSSTHQDRQRARQQRAEAEQRAYEQHQHTRRQLAKAMQTGQPQLLGVDGDGRNVYIEPPAGMGAGSGAGCGAGPGMGPGMGMSGGGFPGAAYGSNGYGYNPSVQGPYRADPNGRYMRPVTPYRRPYGYGYGGGMGLPLLGGLGGGMILGGLLC